MDGVKLKPCSDPDIENRRDLANKNMGLLPKIESSACARAKQSTVVFSSRQHHTKSSAYRRDCESDGLRLPSDHTVSPIRPQYSRRKLQLAMRDTWNIVLCNR